MNRFKFYSLFWALVFVVLAVLFRTVWHLGPNIELVTTASFLAATYLGGAWSAAVPLAAMIISDQLLGNTSIFLFTWSGFALIGLLDYRLIKRSGRRKLVWKQTGMGIAASLFFYLYTNFGVWFLDSFGMYPRTLAGLIECYLMGLPFLKLNLMGNLVFIPLSFTVAEFLREQVHQWLKGAVCLKNLSPWRLGDN